MTMSLKPSHFSQLTTKHMCSVAMENGDSDEMWRKLKLELASSRFKNHANVSHVAHQFLEQQQREEGRKISMDQLVGMVAKDGRHNNNNPVTRNSVWSQPSKTKATTASDVFAQVSRRFITESQPSKPSRIRQPSRSQSWDPTAAKSRLSLWHKRTYGDDDVGRDQNLRANNEGTIGEQNEESAQAMSGSSRGEESAQAAMSGSSRGESTQRGKEFMKKWSVGYYLQQQNPEPVLEQARGLGTGRNLRKASGKRAGSPDSSNRDDEANSSGELLEDFRPRSSEGKTSSLRRRKQLSIHRWAMGNLASEFDTSAHSTQSAEEDGASVPQDSTNHNSVQLASTAEKYFPKKKDTHHNYDDQDIVPGLLVLAPDRETSIRRMIETQRSNHSIQE